MLYGALLFFAFVTVMAARSLIGGYSLGGAGGALAVGATIVGGTAVLVIAGIVLARHQQSRSARLLDDLRERLPASQVFRIYGEADYLIALRLLSDPPIERPPHFGVIAVNREGFQIYVRRPEEPPVTIPREQVESVQARVMPSSDGVPRPTVTVVVDGPSGRRVIVPFVVMREARGAVMPAGMDQARAVVARFHAMSA